MAPFAHERPSPPTTQASTGPFSPLLSAHFPHLASTHLSTLAKLADALYEDKTYKSVQRELDQLQGELRDEYRARARAVKADYMARVVWDDARPPSDASKDDDDVEVQDEDREQEEQEPQGLAHPTIFSDADDAAQMSTRVDAAVTADLDRNLVEARERIEKAVRSTREMELELWLGQAILDGFDVSAGDEDGSARFVQDQLEDALLDAGIDPVPILQAVST
ncbi:hypothetical protein JCM10212_003113 [Sporobolomyces blumeae]